MGLAHNRFKIMVYNYDLISGKVNQLSYQPCKADAFYHQYSYDGENRLTEVRSSTDSIQWENDAAYTYYRHGPLAREQIGSLQLQGIDYAYTVQGWLKSINPSWITPSGTTEQYDSDGMSSVALFERDAYKLNLNYFDDGTYTDFTPVAPKAGYIQGNQLPSTSKKNLYNGNIGSMDIDIRALATSGSRDLGPMIYNYGYDQLNRIARMDAWAASGKFTPGAGSDSLRDYAEWYTYDPNGNILTLNRNGDSVHPAKAKLTYNYIYAKTSGGNGEYVPGQAPTTGVAHLTNQLSSIQVTDSGGAANPNELGTQAAFNYHYNKIGQLTDDDTAKIHQITWNVYGKILSLSDSNNTISYTYDAAGNRISKTAHGITTWYVRDAQGNVMSVYTQGNGAIHGDSLTQTEADIYGSSRLGLLNLSVNCAGSLTRLTQLSLVRGSKLFELTNHLGNVLETISDKKIQHTSDSSTVDYYLADVINANDYYSFGMLMPGRAFAAGSAGTYRYRFNGKEQDPEVKGPDNQYDYGMRMYDPRVGRFLSVDPIENNYPWYTPYQFAGNMPIWAIDLDGLEEMKTNSVANVIKDANGNVLSKPTIVNDPAGSADVIPGVRRLNPTQIEVSPGLLDQKDPYFNTYTWQQVSGNDFIIKQSNTPIGQDAGGNTKPPKTNLNQTNGENDERSAPNNPKPKLTNGRPKINGHPIGKTPIPLQIQASFDPNTDNINNKAAVMNQVQQVVRAMKADPKITVTLSGNVYDITPGPGPSILKPSDPTTLNGQSTDNKGLEDARAKAVGGLLIKQGVNPRQIKYGNGGIYKDPKKGLSTDAAIQR